MPPASTDPATLGLTGSFLVAAYLTYRCWLPPNPNPEGPTAALPRDDLGISTRAVLIRRLVNLSFWTLHALNTVFYPSPPVLLCPNPDNLSRSLFTWSSFTTAVLICIAIAAPIRLLAFRHLGQHFTFRLAKPKALVTTGLYAYVQHPSYPTNWVVLIANFALLGRLDGVLGCVLPSRFVEWAVVSGGFRVWPVLLVAVLGLIAVWVRVKDEEAMLKKVFGKEWEEYHQKTKRFIPWVL